MEINERIFILLEKQGKTAKQLSEYIGVKPSSISAWKTENSYPSSKHMIRISEFFDVSIEFLFTGKIMTTSSQLSSDETELVNTYKKLDRRGKVRVNNTIYEELARMDGAHGAVSKDGAAG